MLMPFHDLGSEMTVQLPSSWLTLRSAHAYTDPPPTNIARTLGLRACRDHDVDRWHALQKLLGDAEVDMTIFFRALANFDVAAPGAEAPSPASGVFADAFYDEAKRVALAPQLGAWLAAYAARVGEDGAPAG